MHLEFGLLQPNYQLQSPTLKRESTFHHLGLHAHLTIHLKSSLSTCLPRAANTLKLSELDVLFIVTPLQSMCCISVTKLLHLYNLQLAHPITTEKGFKISMLVGAYHYWELRVAKG